MNRGRVAFDLAVLAGYLVAANPALTGIPAHEYVGLVAVVVMAAHMVASADGLLAFRRGRWGRAVLNGILLAALATCAVSGVMVSGDVLPALGLYAAGYHFWDPLHALSAKVLLAALLVHVVLRAPMAWAWMRRGALEARSSQKGEGTVLEDDRFEVG